MTLSVTHSTAADGTFSGAGATAWAAAHTLTGQVALNELSAATGANTLASGNFHSQIWNWALSANSVNAFAFGETTAATGGTSTSGVPNQAILKLATLAASTASPLTVYSRGTHVFSVSPSAAQIITNDGAVGTPAITGANDQTSGIYFSGSTVLIARGGVKIAQFNNSANLGLDAVAGMMTATFRDRTSNAYGFDLNTSLVAIANSVETTRWLQGVQQNSKGSADAVGYALNFRKSRGTVASPTVITTGDTLMTISGYGYLGATNTYRETARIQFDSAGTISDATTGIGSVITLYGKTQGTDVTPAAAMTIAGGSTATLQLNGTGMFSANNTVATAITALGPTGANTTVQEWLTVKNAAGTTRYIPCF